MHKSDTPVPDFRNLFESAPEPFVVLLPDSPKFTIVAASDAYLQVTKTQRNEILGKGLFDVFKENPSDSRIFSAENVRASFLRVIEKQTPDIMSVQKYDLRRPDEEGGGFEEKYWRILSSPIFDSNNNLEYIVIRPEDVTDLVKTNTVEAQTKTHLRLSIPFAAVEETKIQAILRYLVPTLLAILAVLAQSYLQPLIGGKVFLLLYPAVFFGAIWGGFTPGIIATVITGLGAWFHIFPPVNSFTIHNVADVFGLVVFFIMGVIFSVFGTALRSFRTKENEHLKNLNALNDKLRTANRELALRESEKTKLLDNISKAERRFRGLIESAQDAIIVTEPTGKIELINDQVSNMFGYAKEELIGQPIEILIPQRAREAHVQHRNGYFANGKNRPMGKAERILSGRRKDGSEFPVDIALSPLETSEGKIVTAIIRDMTERAKRESKSRFLATIGRIFSESLDYEETLKKVASVAVPEIADGCVVRLIKEDGKLHVTSVVHRNPEKQKILENMLQTRNESSAISPELREILASKKVRVRHEITPGDLERLLANSSEKNEFEKLNVNGYVAIPLVTDGRTVGLLGFNSDGEKHRFEESDSSFFEAIGIRAAQAIENARLYRQAQRAKLISDNLPALISYWDKDQRCLFANSTYVQWFGAQPIGRTLKDLLGPEIYQSNLPYINGALGGVAQSFERELKQQSTGENHLVNTTYVPDIVEGKVLGFFVLASDITELKNAIKIREDVLAIVSHDLKNPLAAITLAGQLLKRLKEANPSKLHELSERIEKASSQMLNLIDDLLDFSKIRSGTFSIEKTRETPSDIIVPLIDNFKILAEARQLSFKVEIPQSLARIDCDARRIRQVISNLLGNAIKFTPEGGTITLSALESEGNIQISVSDTGPGIPPENLPKIFDRFWQASETKSLGAGLGLSIAKGIIEAHDGKIWAESIVGKGTTFYILLAATK